MSKPISETPSLSDRVVELELLVTHLARDLSELNGVVIEQQKRIEELNGLLLRLDEQVTRLGDDDEPRDLLSERPPHY